MSDERLASPDERFAVGCMSGTSLDGLDVALVRLVGRRHDLGAEVVRHAAMPFDPALRDKLERLAEDRPAPPSEIAKLARALGDLHADLCERLLDGPEPRMTGRLDFVAAHGQTIAHLPTSVTGPGHGCTWQLLDPFPIADRLDTRVCTDLRGADMAADGEGAPITPAADPILFPVDRAVVVNLGGIANATRWRREYTSGGERLPRIEGGDIGPCNLLLDPLARALLGGVRYDADGVAASSGRPHAGLVAAIEAAIDQAHPPTPRAEDARPRSLGREQFGRSMIDRVLQDAEVSGVTPADALASAVDAVAGRIARWVGRGEGGDVILAGGGARNRALAARLSARMPGLTVKPSTAYGVLPEAREAAAMAVLGAMALDGLGVTVPAITGARRPSPAGRWTLPALRS